MAVPFAPAGSAAGVLNEDDLRRAAAAWLEWQAEMGVDCVLVARSGDAAAEAADREDHGTGAETSAPVMVAARSDEDSASVPSNPSRPRLRGSGGSEAPAVASARALAASCRSLDDLARALEQFDLCPLKATATRLCLCDGNPSAPIMLVGEAPGLEEDRQGKPFVGPSGRLLDRMLATIGLDRSRVYITNTVFWRPPGNRPPTALELATCAPFLERQIELLRPRVLVFVGGIAARALLGSNEGVTKLRGRKLVYEPRDGGPPIPAFVIFHPAYLLRQPLQKKLAWRDLLQLAAELQRLGILERRRENEAEGGGPAEQPR
ncbi:MAG: uracil-DNA glycosylase [Geminicoccaceae bacterium]|nr:uracil-DNA glycosylase [Geminicoccaceae bacterium]